MYPYIYMYTFYVKIISIFWAQNDQRWMSKWCLSLYLSLISINWCLIDILLLISINVHELMSNLHSHKILSWRFQHTLIWYSLVDIDRIFILKDLFNRQLTFQFDIYLMFNWYVLPTGMGQYWKQLLNYQFQTYNTISFKENFSLSTSKGYIYPESS